MKGSLCLKMLVSLLLVSLIFICTVEGNVVSNKESNNEHEIEVSDNKVKQHSYKEVSKQKMSPKWSTYLKILLEELFTQIKESHKKTTIMDRLTYFK